MKTKGWTTTKLMAAGGLGVLNFVLSLLGAGVTTVTGIPGMSGAINAFLGAIIAVFAALLIQLFGTVTIMYTIFSILALPLPLMGTAGFLPKVLLGFVVGILVDLTYVLCRKNDKLVALTVGFVSQYLTGLGIYVLGVWFRLPGIEGLRSFVLGLPAFGFLLVALFGYLGLPMYRRLEHTPIVKRIQADHD